MELSELIDEDIQRIELVLRRELNSLSNEYTRIIKVNRYQEQKEIQLALSTIKSRMLSIEKGIDIFRNLIKEYNDFT